MNDSQRRKLALLRIKRAMPSEFEAAKLSLPNATVLSESEQNLSNALVLFRDWNKSTPHRKQQKLDLIFSSNDAIKSRYHKRLKLALRLQDIMKNSPIVFDSTNTTR